MAKRKITVTVDEGLVETIAQVSTDSVSAVVNSALRVEVQRLARAAALKGRLDEWDAAFGPVSEAARVAAAAAFDDLDAIGPASDHAPAQDEPARKSRARKSPARRRGVA